MRLSPSLTDDFVRLRLSRERWAAIDIDQRERVAERWQNRLLEAGFDRLELVDDSDQLLGRSALVGSGIILLNADDSSGPCTLRTSQLCDLWGMPEGGTVTPDQPIGPICTDTRTLVPGSLFVPLIGERFDAHRFLPEVQGLGATAAVVAHDAASQIPQGCCTGVLRTPCRPISNWPACIAVS